VIRAGVVAVVQPKANRKPCAVVLRTAQDVLRVRVGTVLGTLSGAVVGRVIGERDDKRSGERELHLLLEKGVRSSTVPRVGWVGDWIDSAPYDGRFQMRKVRDALRATAPPLAYSDALPAPSPRRITGSLREVAARLRRG
jgi:hypothetical protein